MLKLNLLAVLTGLTFLLVGNTTAVAQDVEEAERQVLMAKINQAVTEYQQLSDQLDAMSRHYGKKHPEMQKRRDAMNAYSRRIHELKAALAGKERMSPFSDVVRHADALMNSVKRMQPFSDEDKQLVEAVELLQRAINERKVKIRLKADYQAQKNANELNAQKAELDAALADRKRVADAAAKAKETRDLLEVQKTTEYAAQLQAVQNDVKRIRDQVEMEREKAYRLAIQAAMDAQAKAIQEKNGAPRIATGFAKEQGRLQRLESEMEEVKAMLKKVLAELEK